MYTEKMNTTEIFLHRFQESLEALEKSEYYARTELITVAKKLMRERYREESALKATFQLAESAGITIIESMSEYFNLPSSATKDQSQKPALSLDELTAFWKKAEDLEKKIESLGTKDLFRLILLSSGKSTEVI